jgi:hypothetical protein
MLFSKKSARVAEGETIFSSLALNLKSQESREDCVRRDLMHRLKRVCENLSSAEFEALVLKMTREQLRGEGVVHGRTRPC